MLDPLLIAMVINILIIYCIIKDIIDYKKGKRKTCRRYQYEVEDDVELNDVNNESMIKTVATVAGAVVAAIEEMKKENI